MKKNEKNGVADPETTQLNTRVPAQWKQAMRLVSIATGTKMERIMLDILCATYGVGGESIENRCKSYRGAFERIVQKDALPFSQLLTPLGECPAMALWGLRVRSSPTPPDQSNIKMNCPDGCWILKALMGMAGKMGSLPNCNWDSIARRVKDFLSAQSSNGLRPAYLISLRQYLSAFAFHFSDISLPEIGHKELEEWFQGRREKGATRASNIGRLRSFFSFAVRRGWIEVNPCDRLERVKIDRKAPQILSVKAARVLLTLTARRAPECLPYLALCMFAGVRPSEARQLQWSDIRGQFAHISAAASKVRRRRLAFLPANCLEILNSCDRSKPLMPSHSTIRRRLRLAVKLFRVAQCPQDILRHTAASYLLAKHQDAGKVALWLGNSPKILLTHYTELVTPEEAEQFFALNITPD